MQATAHVWRTTPARDARWQRARKLTLRALGFLPLLLVSVVIIGPVLWTVSSSLRPTAESFTLPPQWLPVRPQWSNYGDVFSTIPYGTYVANSAIVSVSVVVGQIVTATLAGYAFGRLHFPARNILFWLVMATMMIPLQATIIPVFVMISKLHLNDTLWSLILPAWPTAFGTFLLRQYFMTMPNDFEEAAVIDGANQWTVFARIYVPLVTPAMAILAVLTFNGTWNDFFRPLIFLSDQQHYTVPLGIEALFGYLSTGSISTVLAGVVLSVVIVMAVYVVGQRYLIEGLTLGGVKS
jgi:multiple sugar transport system permease protein